MIFFLRTKDNKNIIEVETFIDKQNEDNQCVDLSATIYIVSYSKFLIANMSESESIITTMKDVLNLRSWLWDGVFIEEKNNSSKLNYVNKLLKAEMLEFADKLGLKLVED